MLKWSSIAIIIGIVLADSCMAIPSTQNLKLQHGKRVVESVRFTPDGKHLVSASIDGTVIMWDTRSARSMWKIDLDDGARTRLSHTVSEILGMDLAPDGNIVAALGRNQNPVGPYRSN